MDVMNVNGKFVNVTKIDDWWGIKLYVDTAPAPQGPWSERTEIPTYPLIRCKGCGNYHANLMPWLQSDGKLIVGLSNGGPFNLWLANARLYRPGFLTLDVP